MYYPSCFSIINSFSRSSTTFLYRIYLIRLCAFNLALILPFLIIPAAAPPPPAEVTMCFFKIDTKHKPLK